MKENPEIQSDELHEKELGRVRGGFVIANGGSLGVRTSVEQSARGFIAAEEAEGDGVTRRPAGRPDQA